MYASENRTDMSQSSQVCPARSAREAQFLQTANPNSVFELRHSFGLRISKFRISLCCFNRNAFFLPLLDLHPQRPHTNAQRAGRLQTMPGTGRACAKLPAS